MRTMTTTLMILLAVIVVLFGGAESEPDCDAGECFDLAYQISLQPDGAHILVRPRAAEDLAGRVDEGTVRASLESYADTGMGEEAQAQAERFRPPPHVSARAYPRA